MLRMLARIATLAIGGAMLWAAFTVAAQDVTINMGLGTPPLSPVVLSPPQLVAIPGESGLLCAGGHHQPVLL